VNNNRSIVVSSVLQLLLVHGVLEFAQADVVTVVCVETVEHSLRTHGIGSLFHSTLQCLQPRTAQAATAPFVSFLAVSLELIGKFSALVLELTRVEVAIVVPVERGELKRVLGLLIFRHVDDAFLLGSQHTVDNVHHAVSGADVGGSHPGLAIDVHTVPALLDS